MQDGRFGSSAGVGSKNQNCAKTRKKRQQGGVADSATRDTALVAASSPTKKLLLYQA